MNAKWPAPLDTWGVMQRLEPDEGKLSCPVLRGGGLSNGTSLPDEPPGEFCHRQVVAAWLKAQLGVVVEELNPRLRRHRDWIRVMEGT